MIEYWNALGARARIGLVAGALLIVLALAASATWLLRDAHVLLASGLPAERLAAVVRELDREKIAYRIAPDGASVEVPQSKLGKAKAAAASHTLGWPASVGLELFKDTDFSTTDFAQRINYQRALQGELTRTIQAMVGVRSARVHVILADVGVLRRQSTKASAAVEVAMLPGKSLGVAQVRGIQRLVAASVPDIKVDDIVILDESGATLTRSGAESDGGLTATQLELKRQVDGYLEAKLMRLLEDLAPGGAVNLSVDALLDYRQIKVTTEEPIASGSRPGEPATGVVFKERQSVRPGPATTQPGGETTASEASETEVEYKVGHRVEQTVAQPGSIRRVSVAVALRGGPPGVTAHAIEQLVAHGVGIDRLRGDSVSVLLLDRPAGQTAVPVNAAFVAPKAERPPEIQPRSAIDPRLAEPTYVAAALGMLALAAGFAWRRRGTSPAASEAEIERATAQVRAWLADGRRDASL